jgi:ribosomal protein S12 methylthiotransferase
MKVAEGCDYKCAFCIIPTLRGHYRSRSSESLVREARMLASQGVKELLLISQDTTFYGVDRGERGALARLLRDLNKVGGLEWIRLLYLYPTTIDDATLAAMAECEKVCKYIDLPLQHASNPVLKRMKRPGTRRHYDDLLDRIRTRVPDVSLRTTFHRRISGRD